MKLKHGLIGASLALMGLTSFGAEAALYAFQDDDIDFILRPTETPEGTAYVAATGALQTGDVFVSVFEIPSFTIDGVPSIPAGQELTGVAAVQLTAITGTGVGAQYTFGPWGDFNTLSGLNGTPYTSGAAIAMFLNDANTNPNDPADDRNLILDLAVNPASNCTSLTDCVDQATRGSLFQVDGFTEDLDNFWTAVALNAGAGNIDTVKTLNNTLLIASFNVGLGTFFNANGPIGYQNVLTGLPCAPAPGVDGCVQVVGSGTLTGGAGLSNGAVAHSDFDFNKLTAAVPEPGSLALLGVALLGAGVAPLRKRKAA